MGIRRRARREIKKHRCKLIYLFYFSFIFTQSEYQITTIPKNALMLSTHNGFKNFHHTKYEISYLQYPAQINLLNINYNNFNISILDYGLFEDKIDHFSNDTFYAYEGLVNYNFKKNILNQFTFQKSITTVISKLENYTSIALMGNFKIQTNIIPTV